VSWSELVNSTNLNLTLRFFDRAGQSLGPEFSLLLTGSPGFDHAIQMALTPLFSTWTALVTNTPISGTFRFTDTSATNTSRFYRAVWTP
jgi:hypothetical protein